MQGLLLIDCDGTIREPLSGGQFIQHAHDQRIIAGVDRALFFYKDWTIIGITNQGGVASGKKTLDDCVAEQLYTLQLLPQLLKIYFCPDYEGKQLGCAYSNHWSLTTPYGYSSFRKPGKGMLEYCINTHISEKCLYVGDRPEDLQAAMAARIPFLAAELWRDLAQHPCAHS